MITFPNLNSIEEFYQEQIDNAGIYADCIEAKETWWEYTAMIENELADEASENNIPAEIYDLKDRWI